MSDDTLSTSARLAKAERERDEALHEVHILKHSEGLDVVAARLEVQQAVALAGDYAKERDLARAELASARQEIEQLRGELAAARKLLNIFEADNQKADGEQHFAVEADVINRQIRYLCETCGARYGIAYTDHECGPLTAVTVTIARLPLSDTRSEHTDD